MSPARRTIKTHVASFTKEVHPWLAKRPLVYNGRLANRRLISFVKEATGRYDFITITLYVSRGYGYVLWLNR